MAVVIDTNILIRYVTNDDPVKAEKTRLFLEQVEHEAEECIVCEAVMAETIWVLTHPRAYNLSRDEVADFLESFLRIESVKIHPKSLYLRALEMFKTSALDFPDCVLASYVESGRATSIMTFDAKIGEYFPVQIVEL